MRVKLAMISSALLVLASNASAAPVAFTFTGVGSGTLDAVPFTDAAFIITATGDTDDRTSFENGHSIDHIGSMIEIDGIGSLTVITATHTFVNFESQIAGYNRSSQGDLYYAPSDPAFATWDMLTSIGPISGEAELLQWGDPLFESIETSGGVLVFSDSFTNGSFQATVPEPGAFGSSAIALLAVTFTAWHRRGSM